MSLTLTVDGPRWRTHLRAVADATPGLVPVIKGNGYGLGNASLARRAEWIGSDVVAVGLYDEVPGVAERCNSDVLVLTPWRAFSRLPAVSPKRLIHTVTSLADLHALRALEPDARVIAELRTPMQRHGMLAGELAGFAGVGKLAGVSVHLPLADASNAAHVERAITEVIASAVATRTLWVSHVPAAQLTALRQRYPDFVFRPRIGTNLWLGDRGALTATARVWDVHPLERGQRYGYRQRPALKADHLIIASGGTAHGIGLEAPTGDLSPRARAVSLAKGAMDAAGVARSPYSWEGKRLYFAEPPHMQASMLLLAGDQVPAIGDELSVQVRFTATVFDDVLIT